MKDRRMTGALPIGVAYLNGRRGETRSFRRVLHDVASTVSPETFRRRSGQALEMPGI